MKLHEYKTAAERKSALEKEKSIDLSALSESLQDDPSIIHCENLVGAVSVPLGVAGPLNIEGDRVRGDYYIPLATTEGALVASINRGCKTVTVSGGAAVYAYRVGMTRGPVFVVSSLEHNKKLYRWIRDHEHILAEEAEKTSSHLKLKKIIVSGTATYVFVRFHFDTADAMGMNMVTIATTQMVELIEKETGAQCLSVAGNYDIDKKPAWLNFINNRGYKAWAECTLPADIVSAVLKTTPSKVFEVWLAKCMIGSAMSGALGFNAHYANIIAAIFIATGQDPAHVVEGSMGITTAKILPSGSLYFSVYMPALCVGTVGGGTALKTQTAARRIMGVTQAVELAEVTIGAVLAGELSLLASLSEGSLASAHKKLGR